MVNYLPVTVQLIPVTFHSRLLLTGNGNYFYMVALADWLRMLKYLQLEKLSSPYWFGPSLLVIPHFTPWTQVDATCLSGDSLSEWKFYTLLRINQLLKSWLLSEIIYQYTTRLSRQISRPILVNTKHWRKIYSNSYWLRYLDYRLFYWTKYFIKFCTNRFIPRYWLRIAMGIMKSV